MNIKTSMVGYYADRAKEYERIYHKPERQDDLRQLRSFVERWFSEKNVFEVACGTGYWTEIIARSAASVLATDINEEVLAVARSKPTFQPRRSCARRLTTWRPRCKSNFFTTIGV